MHDLIPNHSFPWGCSNLKWGLKGQLYQSPGLHPFFQVVFFFFPFLTTACSVNGSGSWAFQPIESDQRFILSILCHQKSGPVPDFSEFLTVFVYFKRFSVELQGQGGKERRGVGGDRNLLCCKQLLAPSLRSAVSQELEMEKTHEVILHTLCQHSTIPYCRLSLLRVFNMFKG